MALAKNYITRFAIPSLSDADRQALLSADTSEERNRLIWKAYGIDTEKVLRRVSTGSAPYDTVG